MNKFGYFGYSVIGSVCLKKNRLQPNNRIGFMYIFFWLNIDIKKIEAGPFVKPNPQAPFIIPKCPKRPLLTRMTSIFRHVCDVQMPISHFHFSEDQILLNSLHSFRWSVAAASHRALTLALHESTAFVHCCFTVSLTTAPFPLRSTFCATVLLRSQLFSSVKSERVFGLP